MKLIAVLLTVVFVNVQAKGISQTVTLSCKDLPLPKVFIALEKQTGYVFMYSDEVIKDTKPVTVNVKSATLEQVLNILFKDQPVVYAVIDKTIVLSKKKMESINPSQQDNTKVRIDVHGRVVNENGEPVSDVTVTIKETNVLTMTNENGEFSLHSIEQNAILVFTHVSMEPFELKVSGKTELAITLKAKISALSEISVQVNTGYQQVSKEKFVGAYSQLDKNAYDRRAGMDILSRLDGTLTGVLIDKKSSGNILENIQTRGFSTIRASKAPLIILDNFPYTLDISNINPNDVESVTVLKDAAATSIWGARAGNGVIIINTKKGKYNQSLHVSARSNVTVTEKPDLFYYPQMGVADFVDLEETLFNRGFYDANLANTTYRPAISPVVEMLANRKAGKISSADSAEQINAFKTRDIRNDLNKYAYRNPISQQHYIDLGMGTNILAYNFSAGYNRVLNNVQRSKADDQFTLNSSIKLRPIKNLEISNLIRYAQGTERSASFSLPGKIYPYAQLADAEGRPLAVPNNYRVAYLDTVGNGQLLDWRYRPLEEPGLVDRENVSRSVLFDFNLTYRVTAWLTASVNYQYANESANSSNYAGLQSYYTRNLINQFTDLTKLSPALRSPVPIGGILDVANNKTISQNARGRLNFDKTFAAQHQVTAMIAEDISESNIESNTNRFYGYDQNTGKYQTSIDFLTYYNNQFTGGSSQIPNGNYHLPKKVNRFVSFSGNASYTFKKLYTIYASARKDGSNVFGVNTNNKWKPLWATGINWDISRESFYRIKWVPSLRLRASFGFAGNPGASDVTGLPIIAYGPTPAYLTNLIWASPKSAPNPDLRWEKVRTVNGGIDFSMFNNRLSGNIDVWQKNSTDLISGVPYAPATGIVFFVNNSADLRGNGFEINVTSENISGPTFKWQTNLGLSYAKTVVTKLYAFNARYTASDFIDYSLNATEGRIVYGLSSYRWVGLDPSTGDPRGYLNKKISTDYNSIFNDSIQNQVFNGSAIPLYFGFISNSVSWKNLTLSANITYRLNFYFRKPTINYSQLANSWQGHSDYELRWKQPGDEKFTNVPSFTYPINSSRDQFFQYSEINVLRGDNIRLQDVRLQYDWTNKKSKKTLKNFQVFFYANNLNLIIWRKNKSKLDPDFVGASNVLSVPIPKTWTGGINLSF